MSREVDGEGLLVDAESARGVKQAGEAIREETERQDFIAAHDRLVGLAGELNAWHSQQAAGSVYWIESSWNRRGTPRMTGPKARPDRIPSVWAGPAA